MAERETDRDSEREREQKGCKRALTAHLSTIKRQLISNKHAAVSDTFHRWMLPSVFTSIFEDDFDNSSIFEDDLIV